ncbi:MAG: RraA family protein [Alphaproteobacteria bacterium]
MVRQDRIDRPAENLSERLSACYSGAVHDTLREMGRTNCVLPSAIQPLDPSHKLAGRVFTMEGHLEPGLDGHETLLRWTEFLSRAPAGAVVMCQPHDSTIAHMGELSAETLQVRGVRGYIVDGGCRDTAFILRMAFPVFCRYRTPRDVVGVWVPDRFGEAIEIGGVAIESEDYVFADRDGVVIIPAGLAEQAVAEVEKMMQTENVVRKAILDGMDPRQAYLKYRKF